MGIGSGRRPVGEVQAARDEFLRLMECYDYRQMSQTDQGKVVGVTANTISRWMREVSAEKWAEWGEMDRRNKGRMTVRVDDSLTSRALGGDVAAIKLWYQKKLDWSEKQISENINRNADLEHVKDSELLKHFPKEALEAALREKGVKESLEVIEPEPKTSEGGV